MRIIKREIINDVQIQTAAHNIDEYLPFCQASFNSDGNITLRNYNCANKAKDEIIILSKTETKAVFALFSEIGQINKNFNLPF